MKENYKEAQTPHRYYLVQTKLVSLFGEYSKNTVHLVVSIVMFSKLWNFQNFLFKIAVFEYHYDGLWSC